MSCSLRLSARTSPELLVAIGIYLLAGCLLLSGLLVYKISGESYTNLWSGRFRGASAVAVLGVSGAIVLIGAAFQKAAAARRKTFWVPVAANALALLACLVFGEVSLRLAAQPDALGLRVGGVTLLPYDWRAFARDNLSILERTRSDHSFYVEDAVLGWTIAPDRDAADGIHKSSAEGLRTMNRGTDLRSQQAQHRVALFGDSFTFGEDVPFEQSWGHFLEAHTSPGTQVLNFGVDGYGLDQAYLRFRREVNKWTPDATVLAFIQDDLYRSVGVYPFFRLTWQRPFSKPRFILNGTELKLLNVPNIPPDQIFRKSSAVELPFLQYDANFQPTAYGWEPHFLYGAYLARFIAAKFPRWSPPGPDTGDEMALQLASRLIKEFVAAAHSEQTVPIVIYLPSRNDFDGTGPVLERQLRKLLSIENIELEDTTDCVRSHVSRTELFLEGRPHYSSAGNAAVAKCVAPLITAQLN